MPISNLMNLSEQLRFYIDEYDISVATLARKSGVGKTTIHSWLNGSPPRKMDQLKKVADALSCTVDNLLFGKGKEVAQDSSRLLDVLMGEENWVSGVFEIKVRRLKR